MRVMITVFALAILSGCAATQTVQAPDTRVIDTACDWVKFITTVPADSYETKQQVFAHDQAFLANCLPQDK